MQSPDEVRGPFALEAWRSLNDQEEATMDFAMTADQIRTLASAKDKEGVHTHRVGIGVIGTLCAMTLYNVFTLDQPWIRLAQTWLFGVLVWMFAPGLQRGPARLSAGEPSGLFLERHYVSLRDGMLHFHRSTPLMLPGLLFGWMGGGPVARLKAWGVSPDSWIYRFSETPWPFAIALCSVIAIWCLTKWAAEKADCDARCVRRAMDG